MKFLLCSYDNITSKKNNKKYLIIHTIISGRSMYNLILPYTEINEEFCKNNINEDITEYIDYRLYNNQIVPYIKF